MNLLIVDDHPLVCSGIKNILSSEKEFSNIIESNDIKTALELMSKMDISLSLVDVRLKDECGIDFIKAAKESCPSCKFIVLSSSSDPYDFDRAVQAGADGYILKDAFPEDIIYAVKTVLRGRKYYDPVFMENRVTDSRQDIDLKTDEILSPREAEILECLGIGLSNRDISRKLYISENTVKKHISSILAKLNLNDRTQAALFFSKMNDRRQ